MQTDPQLAVVRKGDIIEFYNTVFIPEAKALLLGVNAGRLPLRKPPGEPAYKTQEFLHLREPATGQW